MTKPFFAVDQIWKPNNPNAPLQLQPYKTQFVNLKIFNL